MPVFFIEKRIGAEEVGEDPDHVFRLGVVDLNVVQVVGIDIKLDFHGIGGRVDIIVGVGGILVDGHGDQVGGDGIALVPPVGFGVPIVNDTHQRPV